MREHREIKRLAEVCVGSWWQGQKLRPLRSALLFHHGTLLPLNAVEWVIIMGSTSELLEEDQLLSLSLGLFPGWLCRDSKTRVGKEGWEECRVS